MNLHGRGNYAGMEIVEVSDWGDHVLFMDLHKKEPPPPDFPLLHGLFAKEKFELDFIRGRIVGIIRKTYE